MHNFDHVITCHDIINYNLLNIQIHYLKVASFNISMTILRSLKTNNLYARTFQSHYDNPLKIEIGTYLIKHNILVECRQTEAARIKPNILEFFYQTLGPNSYQTNTQFHKRL